jgi:hypothetical protein
MKTPVICGKCQQTFPVSQEQLGQSVRCPYCDAETETVAPQPNKSIPEQPLSLDDAEPLPAPPPKPLQSSNNTEAPPKPSPKRSLSLTTTAILSLGSTVLLVVGIYFGFQWYWNRDAISWREYRPPEGRCVVEMPGDVQPDAESQGAGFRCRAEVISYSPDRKKERKKETLEFRFAWVDSPTPQANDQLWETSERIFDRELRRFGSKKIASSTEVKRAQGGRSLIGLDQHFQKDDGSGVIRVIVPLQGDHRRFYILSVVGPSVSPDQEHVRRFLDSLTLD